MMSRLRALVSARRHTASPPQADVQAEAVEALARRVLFRGYGPLVVVAVLFAVMAALVPTINRESQVIASADGFGGGGGGAQAQNGGPDGEAAPGAQGTTPDGGATASGPGSGSGVATQSAGGTTTACSGQDRQVPGDPYSPACVEWSGNNGGTTARGVTADDFVVSARILDEKGFQQTLAELAGAEITDEPEDVRRTIDALVEFFNRRYQFYGRRMKIAFYDGAGSSTVELQGGGQEQAEADAIHVAERIKAFAEMNAGTVPFADALSRRDVVNVGVPYVSREWFLERRPFAWSTYTDCSLVAEMGAEFVDKQVLGKTAKWAGPAFRDRRRKYAVIAPENRWYQQCVDAAERMHEAAGNDYDLRIAYKLDIATMSNQAASVVAKLKSEAITTVSVPTDPIFPVFLTAKAEEQGYEPEWILVGTAFTDANFIGQLYEQHQWARNFGISFLGSPRPARSGLGYQAYKTVRDDEPAFAVELVYATMLMLAIGVQMAGPSLTPASFEQGMFAYGGGTGPYGTWGFDADSYSPTQDYRVLWWNTDALAPDNNRPGVYVEAYGGRRFLPGTLPSEDPPVFAP